MTNNIAWNSQVVTLTIADHTGRTCVFKRYLTLQDYANVAASSIDAASSFVLFLPEDHEVLRMFFAGELDHPEDFKGPEPAWADGDVIRAPSETIVWVRAEGVWNTAWPPFAEKDVPDAQMSRLVRAGQGWTVLASANEVE